MMMMRMMTRMRIDGRKGRDIASNVVFTDAFYLFFRV